MSTFNAQSLARIETVRKALGPTFAFLRTEWCLWHRTSINGLRGILAAGAILPNDGHFPYRYAQSNQSRAWQLDGVSLFELYSLPEDRALLSGMDWMQYLIDHPRATVWIRIDPARLDFMKELRKFVTVPVGDGALDAIEAQVMKWRAEDEAEYAANSMSNAACYEPAEAIS